MEDPNSLSSVVSDSNQVKIHASDSKANTPSTYAKMKRGRSLSLQMFSRERGHLCHDGNWLPDSLDMLEEDDANAVLNKCSSPQKDQGPSLMPPDLCEPVSHILPPSHLCEIPAKDTESKTLYRSSSCHAQKGASVRSPRSVPRLARHYSFSEASSIPSYRGRSPSKPQTSLSSECVILREYSSTTSSRNDRRCDSLVASLIPKFDYSHLVPDLSITQSHHHLNGFKDLTLHD